MKSFLTFLSLLAVGIIIASAYSLIEGGVLSLTPLRENGGYRLDYRSLSMGLIIGFILSYLTRVSWNEIPRRTISWIWAKKEGSLIEFVFLIVLLLILLFL
ncbi:MAG: hypothetical protein ACKOW3_09375 [Hyphomicrobium sp.]